MKRFLFIISLLICFSLCLSADDFNRVFGVNSSPAYGGAIPIAKNFVQHYSNTKALLPSAYSSVDMGYITPVRNQGVNGCCWAFSACASMEAYYLKHTGKTLIFSPLDFVYQNPYPYTTLSSGGNVCYSAAYLSGLNGPVLESDEPYVSPYTQTVPHPDPAGYCDNVFILSDDSEKGLENNEILAIKEKVYDFGAAEICVNIDSRYFSYNDKAYYCPEISVINHAVTIVGWDDKYSRSNFRNNPGEDGAFLIKNSWGTYRHDNGYFWLSYKDRSLSQASAYDFTEKSQVNYNDRLSYLSAGAFDTVSMRYGKVVYKPTSIGYISAVRTYVAQGDSDYFFRIYVNGTEKGKVSVHCDYPGYVTGYLSKNISYSANDKITLECDFNSENSGTNIMPVQGNFYGLVPVLGNGTNYYSSDGYSYTDFANDNATKNKCIGAYLLVAAKSVKLNKTSVSCETGSKGSLKAEVIPDSLSDKSLVWKSSDDSVVSVSGTNTGCTYKGLKAGVAYVRAGLANDPNVYAECKVTVKDPVIHVSSVTLSDNTKSIYIGNTAKLSVNVLPENATDRSVTWKSSDNEIAKIASDGTVTALSEGKVTITVKSNDGGISDKCTVTVERIVPESIKLNITSISLKVGNDYDLVATVLPENATNKKVTWKSTDESVVYVDQTGYVYAMGAGTAYVSATTKDGGLTAKCKITAKNVVPTKVALNKTSLSLTAGKTYQLKETISPSNATITAVTWKSSNTKVATVDKNGKVKGLLKGTATITVTTKDGKKTATCKVTVKNVVPTKVKLNASSVSVKVGKTYTLKVTVSPSNATVKTVTWKSSNTKIATVDKNGIVKGIAKGTATITVTTDDGNKTAKCKITVKNIEVTKITLSKTALSLAKGKTYTLKATVTPSNATVKTVIWKSGDTKIATVSSDGKVKGIKKGTVTVKAVSADNSKVYASCKVTVK